MFSVVHQDHGASAAAESVYYVCRTGAGSQVHGVCVIGIVDSFLTRLILDVSYNARRLLQT